MEDTKPPMPFVCLCVYLFTYVRERYSSFHSFIVYFLSIYQSIYHRLYVIFLPENRGKQIEKETPGNESLKNDIAIDKEVWNCHPRAGVVGFVIVLMSSFFHHVTFFSTMILQLPMNTCFPKQQSQQQQQPILVMTEISWWSNINILCNTNRDCRSICATTRTGRTRSWILYSCC
jgi:hypothetical protein